MDSGFQYKVYNYEVAPPSGVWEKIAEELDESELSQKFPSGLYNFQVTPPAGAWLGIAAALDESALVSEFAGTLNNMEVVPPVSAWNKIKNSLDSAHETAIPERRKILPFVRYAAAAAVIAFLAWGGIQLFDKKSGNTTVAKQETDQPKEKVPVTVDPPAIILENTINNTELAALHQEARNDAALEASKKTYARLEASVPRTKIKNVANFFFAPDNDEPGTRGFSIEPAEIEPPDISSRYIMLMTPDGKIIRMSKKLGNLVCCVSGEDEDKDCIDQMRKWREKIANTPAGHSPGNFMELLNLVNSLQDN